MGDFNWVTPQFLAFASPQQQPTHEISTSSPMYATLPSNIAEVQRSGLPGPFKNVLSHFCARNVGLVVRLNSELYSSTYFTKLGIQHLNMIFDDGTCPSLKIVRNFVNLAHEMITVHKKGIAVHCKAGLGRTGCLIGAYLIYKHGFTANEIIAYMRFMRPGMVVGPQQHWLHLNQGIFREWWHEDKAMAKYAEAMPSTPTKSPRKQRLASVATRGIRTSGCKRTIFPRRHRVSHGRLASSMATAARDSRPNVSTRTSRSSRQRQKSRPSSHVLTVRPTRSSICARSREGPLLAHQLDLPP
jgi:protein-tyrosine phosphatase